MTTTRSQSGAYVSWPCKKAETRRKSNVLTATPGISKTIARVVLIFILCSVAASAQVRKWGIGKFQGTQAFAADSSFSIELPEYMVETNDLDASAKFQCKNISSKTYLLVYKESEPLSHLMLEGELLQASYKLFEKNIAETGGKIELYPDLQIDGYPAIQSKVDLALDDVSLSLLATFIEVESVLYKIYCCTLTSQMQEFNRDFKHIARSFVIEPEEQRIKAGRKIFHQ